MLKKFLFNKADRGIVQLFRYALVVAIAAPIDFGGYVILASRFDMGYVLASVISFTVSLIVNYFLCIKWIWTDHTSRQKHIDAIIFFLIGIVGLLLTSALIWIFTSFLDVHYILAKLITFGFVFIWSFGSRRYLFSGKLLSKNIKQFIIQNLHLLTIIFLSLFYVVLQYNHFFNILEWTDTDDALQYELSKNFTNGQWLGEYGRLTLIKGVGFPLWGAFLHMAHVPLWLGNSILMIIACMAVVYALRRLVAHRWVLVVTYGILLFNPMVTTRIYRDTIIPALTLLVCAWGIGMFVMLTNRHKHKAQLLNKDVATFTLIGLVSLPMWYYTREDAIWLMPFIYSLLGIGLFYCLYHLRGQIRLHAKHLCTVLALLVLPFLTVHLVGITIAELNQRHYGRYVVNDYFSKDFEHAYATLHRIESTQPKLLSIPVSEDMRNKAYQASPAFKELQGCLDSAEGVCVGFKLTGPHRYAKDYEGGWFPFALRLAVQEAGHYDTASEASAYYTRLAKEIDVACDLGTLKCQPVHMTSFMPLPNEAIVKGLIPNTIEAISFLLPLKHTGEEKSFDPTKAIQSPYSDEIAQYYGVRYTIPELGFFGKIRKNITSFIHFVYAIINPVLLLLSTCSLVVATWLKFRKDANIDWRILTILWLLLATILLRVAMLIYVHTVSFPTVFPLYYASVYPLLFLFEGFSLILLAGYIVHKRKGRKT